MNYSTEILVLIIGLAAVISTFLGGLFAIRLKDRLHLILGFSAGAVIAVALFDLLPESFSLMTSVGWGEQTPLFIGAGFLLYLILDRFFSLHSHDDHDCHNPGHKGKIGAIMLIVHSFLDGLIIGLAFKVSPAVGWVVAVAVLAHDFSDGINTANMVIRRHGTRSETLKWLLFDALAPLAGIITAIYVVISASSLGVILAIFTGFFLYLGASDLIPESHHNHPTVWTTVATILGVVVLYTVILIAG